jgi:hypothetical protein
MQFDLKTLTLKLTFSDAIFHKSKQLMEKHANIIIFFLLSMVSIAYFLYYLSNGLGVAYNDARSHLDISRRVVENITPGFAQLGSVWLPLPHLLATLTIWNDFMWHSGLAGAIQSMVAFVATGIMIYLILKTLGVGMFGRIAGVAVFALNLNILYMQSTAMTELLLIGTMTAGMYQLLMWHKEGTLLRLLQAAFWIMLSTLIRYDGWFLLAFAFALICIHSIRTWGYKKTEGLLVLFTTLASFGIVLWLFWNLMIFKDPLYFAFGPYSANAQQSMLEAAGVLETKRNLPFSVQTYVYAMIYNAGFLTFILGVIGMVMFWFDKRIKGDLRIAAIALMAPFFFNIVALFLGHSVLFVQGLHGNSWFNVRYGLMMVPTIAIFIGYLLHRVKSVRYVLASLLLFVSVFSFTNGDAVTIDDAVVGASGKNVAEVSGWLQENAKDKDGFVLISAASHDAIIFSSRLPMKRFIHEGTGKYWDEATTNPTRWARWIVLRTDDMNDSTFRELKDNRSFKENYTLVRTLPFADIYELKPDFVNNLETKATLALD